MSSSDESPAIHLTDDRETVREKLAGAYSGGRQSLTEHCERGGDPDIDVAYRLLSAFFEPDDDELERLAREYRTGDLLSGDLKARATERIADFLDAHQSRRPTDAELDDALAPYRPTAAERERALSRVGLGPDVTLAFEGG